MAETLSSPALWQPWPVSRAQVACIIPAKDEQQRIAATVTAARELPHVSLVLVCDDGSSDQTAQFAAGAGAIVVSHHRNRGKAAAIESAVNALGVLEQRDDRPESGTLLLLDADLEDSAANCGPLIEPVVAGRADLTIGVLPPQRTAAGAIVVSHHRNRGKAAAIESAVNALGVLEQRDDRPESGTLLLLDADLEDSAANCGPLIEPVVAGRADLTIGVLPPQRTAAGEAPGGLGLVMTTARRGIQELTGWTPRAPLSGQRCITRRAFEVASPLAAGWGVEVGMTIDVLRAGLKVEEIEIELRHRATGSDLGSQLHRAKQLRDVTRALAARGLVQAGIKELKDSGGVQGLLRRLKR